MLLFDCQRESSSTGKLRNICCVGFVLSPWPGNLVYSLWLSKHMDGAVDCRGDEEVRLVVARFGHS